MANSANRRERKNEKSNCCGRVTVIKNCLHFFNILFLISGGAILGLAIWTIICKHQYISLLTTSTYAVGTYTLAFAGALAVTGGILGCCGIIYENRPLILTYTFVVVLVFVIEAIVGGFAYIYEMHLEGELYLTLNDTFLTSYAVDEKRTDAIDLMQQDYACCGAIRFEDWRESIWLKSLDRDELLRPPNHRVVPDSCCITLTDECGKSDHPSNIPYTGCIYKLSDEIRQHLALLGVVSLGISLLHVIGIILGSCLYVKLKDDDD